MNDNDWLIFQRQIANIVAAVLIGQCKTSAPLSAAIAITEWIQREYDVRLKSS